MDRFISALALVVALLLFAPAGLRAQASASSSACARADTVCFPVRGRVVFEAGAAKPLTVAVSAVIWFPRYPEGLELRASAPDYEFEVQVPRFTAPTFRIEGLAAPWIDDHAKSVPVVDGPQTVELRAVLGVPVTATFRAPPGDALPRAFAASVRRYEGDQWFRPVIVNDGRFTFLARRGVAYTIAAWPSMFRNVAADFPATFVPQSVFVDVPGEPRLAQQSALTLVEGPPAPGSGTVLRNVLVPVALTTPTPSGGGLAPYAVQHVPGSGVVAVSVLSPVSFGRSQRLGMALVAIDDDKELSGLRSGALRFSPHMGSTSGGMDLPYTLLDDEASGLPPLLRVAGAEQVAFGRTSMALAQLEGGRGDGWTIVLELDKPAPSGGASVVVDTVSGKDLEYPSPFDRPRELRSFAIDGLDYVPVVNRRVTFAPGSRTASLRIEGIGNDRIQPERHFFLAFTDADGLVPRDPSIELRIVNDDVDGSSAARNDLLPVTPLPKVNVLDVLANDSLPGVIFENGSLVVIDAPRHGSVRVLNRGTSTPIDDQLEYVPAPGRGGQVDRFRYQVCGALDEICVAASVDIPIRPVASDSMAFRPETGGGFRDFMFAGLPELPDARAVVMARPLRDGEAGYDEVPPSSPRFGIQWRLKRDLPALPEGVTSVERTLISHVQGPSGSDVDLHLAYDANDDGRIDGDERLCSSASTGASETCLVTFSQTRNGASKVWAAIENPGPAPIQVHSVHAYLDDLSAIRSATATAPTRLGAGEGFPLRLSWRNDETPLQNGVVGVLRLGSAGSSPLGDVPVVINQARETTRVAPIAEAPRALRSGVAVEQRLFRDVPLDRLFIDVPPGTERLGVSVVRTRLDSHRVTITLRHVALRPTAAPPIVQTPEPIESSPAARSFVGAAGEAEVMNPTPGRWFVVLTKSDDSLWWSAPTPLQITATLSNATAPPVIRPGGYFNPSRSGHGLFLYPAGNDWAGLWYTYQQDGEPVWYYLQGAKPGANGIWTAPIFRSGWNGSRNHLTEVGRATITPTADDAFQFTYVLDGETGSEPFTSFGRGCPSIDGRVVDASGHWFDPARAGAGYSLQLLPNYEFHAVFAYSARGEPRFLVAERNGVGAANQTLPLQQLRGFCPLCTRSGDPQRATVGVLRREFVNGQLSRIAADAAFTNGTTGTWVVNDAVVPLGGLQGCAAN